jgi:DNA-binding transcriptional regulator GbsR (MarR family)
MDPRPSVISLITEMREEGQMEKQVVDDTSQRASALIASAVGDLMEFWNFKPSLGRVWATLYLSQDPMDAEEIEARSGLSSGNVSISLQELLQWGAVKRAPQPGRRRLFLVETDIWLLVARVMRERELRVIARSIEHMEEALRLLNTEGRSSDPTAMLQNRFIATRVATLLELAKAGHRMVERLSRTGNVNFRSIRDVLLSR